MEIFSEEIPCRHVQNKTECYDCNIKEVFKRFSVYIIYDTLNQFIHCIIWAKSYLLTEVFNIEEDNPAVFNHSGDSNNAAEIKNFCKKVNALKQI